MRPIHDLKLFDGVVVEDRREWFEIVSGQNPEIDAATLVTVAEPKEIYEEYRVFVVRRRVVAASLYRRAGRPDRRRCAPASLELFQPFADRWLPHETVVMDIAVTPEGPKVIEFNCFNCAGFYASDVGAVIRSLD
ncbi:MAG: ATP-grasp domain-containing protein [Acidobacteria bacterium]|nr:ATP-grasp domain-containing protein [Acidobacteriota bacterium]